MSGAITNLFGYVQSQLARLKRPDVPSFAIEAASGFNVVDMWLAPKDRPFLKFIDACNRLLADAEKRYPAAVTGKYYLIRSGQGWMMDGQLGAPAAESVVGTSQEMALQVKNILRRKIEFMLRYQQTVDRALSYHRREQGPHA